jgi:hypothetical protein
VLGATIAAPWVLLAVGLVALSWRKPPGCPWVTPIVGFAIVVARVDHVL